jgi:integrase
MKLTQTAIAKIELAPGQAERIVFDERLSGFGLRVRAGGKRTWIVQYRVGKKQRRKTLGSVDKIMAAKAYEVAEQDLAGVTLGTSDPQAKKIEARAKASETFETIATRFLRAKEGQVKQSSFDQIETHLTKHWATLNGRSVHDISRRDIAIRLGEIAQERGPYAGNRARATLSSFYGWAMNEGIVEANPVVGTNRQTDEKARDRVLSDAELVAIWNASTGDYGGIVRLLILTAQRRDEVGAIARSELDLAGRKWTIPSARTKNGREHEIPLSDSALVILKAATARKGREGREAVFGDSEGGNGFSGWSKAKAALDQRMADAAAGTKEKKKPVPWRVHDIRRTVATRMADLGVLPHVIEAVLNHISGHKAGVAGVYNRALYSAEKRQALDLWAAHVEALIAGKTASNIVPMKA